MVRLLAVLCFVVFASGGYAKAPNAPEEQSVIKKYMGKWFGSAQLSDQDETPTSRAEVERLVKERGYTWCGFEPDHWHQTHSVGHPYVGNPNHPISCAACMDTPPYVVVWNWCIPCN